MMGVGRKVEDDGASIAAETPSYTLLPSDSTLASELIDIDGLAAGKRI
jgi:hypothetical protein